MDTTQDYSADKPRYKQLSEPIKIHQHEYDIVACETIVIRFCPDCGMAWKLNSTFAAPLFADEWTVIREPSEEH